MVSLNNDTVGTLVSRRFFDSTCDIGGIVGTGTNFCYAESLSNIHTLTSADKRRYNKREMIINIESGNFNKLPRNVYDIILDKDSVNRGRHLEEKMVSGLYLGELTRLVIVDLITKGLLFSRRLSQKELALVNEKGSFKTSFLTKITGDTSGTLTRVDTLLRGWGIKKTHISLEDKRIIKNICQDVVRRAARITAAVVFSIVTHIDREIASPHTIAIDGSVFEKTPQFEKEMVRALKEVSTEFFGDDRSQKISFRLTTDGSGVGAAIIAATAKSSTRLPGKVRRF